MTAEDFVWELANSGLPVENVIVYDAESDKNGLLGRPGQYTSKVNFADGRVEQLSEDSPVGGTVEVFKNAKDAKTRADYIEKVTEGVSVLRQYQYLHRNVLLRIDYDLTPEQAAEYEKVFLEIFKSDKYARPNHTAADSEDTAVPDSNVEELDKTTTVIKEAKAVNGEFNLTADEIVKKINELAANAGLPKLDDKSKDTSTSEDMLFDSYELPSDMSVSVFYDPSSNAGKGIVLSIMDFADKDSSDIEEFGKYIALIVSLCDPEVTAESIQTYIEELGIDAPVVGESNDYTKNGFYFSFAVQENSLMLSVLPT